MSCFATTNTIAVATGRELLKFLDRLDVEEEIDAHLNYSLILSQIGGLIKKYFRLSSRGHVVLGLFQQKMGVAWRGPGARRVRSRLLCQPSPEHKGGWFRICILFWTNLSQTKQKKSSVMASSV